MRMSYWLGTKIVCNWTSSRSNSKVESSRKLQCHHDAISSVWKQCCTCCTTIDIELCGFTLYGNAVLVGNVCEPWTVSSIAYARSDRSIVFKIYNVWLCSVIIATISVLSMIAMIKKVIREFASFYAFFIRRGKKYCIWQTVIYTLWKVVYSECKVQIWRLISILGIVQQFQNNGSLSGSCLKTTIIL